MFKSKFVTFAEMPQGLRFKTCQVASFTTGILRWSFKSFLNQRFEEGVATPSSNSKPTWVSQKGSGVSAALRSRDLYVVFFHHPARPTSSRWIVSRLPILSEKSKLDYKRWRNHLQVRAQRMTSSAPHMVLLLIKRPRNDIGYGQHL